ncbi:MAG: ATPase, T2SS/T4P/T4SS family, partial [Candidatus Levybacteria bacterium]|nr:ATPase, T2SS/T4P/T4SS family [Candidatus Levybacteria bacterium]
MLITPTQLKVLLVGANLLTSEKFEGAEKEAEELRRPIEEVLVEKELISDIHLGQIIANYLNVPFMDLTKVEIPPDVLKIIPEVVAKKQKIIAFALGVDGLKLGMADPTNKNLQVFIAKKSGVKVIPYLVSYRGVELSLKLYRKELQASFDDLLKNALNEVHLAGSGQAAEAPIIKIVDLLVEYAYQNRASDIHIEPEKDQSIVRFRLDGVLHDVLRITKNVHEQVISRIKVLAKLKTDEHLSAQDGKMQMTLPDEDLDVRVSIVPITKGEKAVLRLLSSKSRQLTLTDLGMNESDLIKVRDGFAKPYGMILATGPTGSGKTTSIYAILKILNNRDINIASIEDPVEYDISGINQIQVNTKTNLTFANGLRSILRQDPNIIFVGEIRDP